MYAKVLVAGWGDMDFNAQHEKHGVPRQVRRCADDVFQ